MPSKSDTLDERTAALAAAMTLALLKRFTFRLLFL
jgi:hypothetical protein